MPLFLSPIFWLFIIFNKLRYRKQRIDLKKGNKQSSFLKYATKIFTNILCHPLLPLVDVLNSAFEESTSFLKSKDLDQSSDCHTLPASVSSSVNWRVQIETSMHEDTDQGEAQNFKCHSSLQETKPVVVLFLF